MRSFAPRWGLSRGRCDHLGRRLVYQYRKGRCGNGRVEGVVAVGEGLLSVDIMHTSDTGPAGGAMCDRAKLSPKTTKDGDENCQWNPRLFEELAYDISVTPMTYPSITSQPGGYLTLLSKACTKSYRSQARHRATSNPSSPRSSPSSRKHPRLPPHLTQEARIDISWNSHRILTNTSRLSRDIGRIGNGGEVRGKRVR